jgi:signal transduction histidine kinase
VSLDAIASSIADDYDRSIREAGGALDISPSLPTILGDPRYLYQILGNLVGNSIKYRSPDRPLEISLTCAAARSPRRTIIQIRDNGRGIPAEKLDRLFVPFQRIEEHGIEGTGVGLACVKRLVEKLGGDINVESRPGEGTCFMIELRVVQRAPDAG